MMTYQTEYLLSEKQKIIKQLQQENLALKQRVTSLENYNNDLKQNLTNKQAEIINTAHHNAEVIIAKAVNVAYHFKIALDKLWTAINDSKHDPKIVLQLITNFFEQNRNIFMVNNGANDYLQADIKKKLQTLLKNTILDNSQ